MVQPHKHIQVQRNGFSGARITSEVRYNDLATFLRLLARQAWETPARYRRGHALCVQARQAPSLKSRRFKRLMNIRSSF